MGVADRMAETGKRVIRTELIEQHRAFYPLLPMVVLGAADPAGDVWATIRAGHPGFLTSPDTRTLRVDLPREASDPADAGMEDGDALGCLASICGPAAATGSTGMCCETAMRAFS